VQVAGQDSVRLKLYEVAKHLVAPQFLLGQAEKTGVLIDLLLRVGCDCGGGTNCFGVTSAPITSATLSTAFSNITISTSAGYVIVDGGKVVSGTGQVDIAKMLLSAIYGLLPNGTKKRQIPSTGTDYSIVKNVNGAVTGQLAGNGLNVGLTGVSSVAGTVPTRDDITPSGNNTKLVIAMLPPNGTNIVIVDQNPQISNLSTIQSASSTFTQSGTYFAAYVDPSTCCGPPIPTSASSYTPGQPTGNPVATANPTGAGTPGNPTTGGPPPPTRTSSGSTLAVALTLVVTAAALLSL